MSPELDAKLRASYPRIFTVDPVVDPDDSDVPPAPSAFATWGFECGDGWYDLLNALCLNLQHATKRGASQVVAIQVKEKFGGLCFYANGLDAEQAGMIELAETMSKQLCEVCGNRGKTIRIVGIKTRCPEHEND
ncbi:conserved hypothetical protein [Paraburkholderia atlantica]|uniref:Uncharacterized protein n=1 Tax=Paraburkholderia atlantica TaxID=2654982 RepID=D5WI91_PARAM|nr:hypothetical protein [Paraburkholderia atlantica]ADG18186.1 conserved hypothetical protein [Paraburkholderia atlantica]